MMESNPYSHLDETQLKTEFLQVCSENKGGVDFERIKLLLQAFQGVIFDVVRFLINRDPSIRQWKCPINNKHATTERAGAIATTPIQITSKEASFNDIVKCLIQEGKADVNKVDNDGQTPLFYASRTFGDEIITDGQSVTPGSQFINIVKKFLAICEEDALSIGDRNNSNRLDSGFLEIVKILIHQGKADVDIADDSGFTPLHISIENGHVAIVECLIHEAIADVDLLTRIREERL
eukprot:Awhi_evm1s1684